MQALLSKYKNAPKRDRSRDGGGNRARGRSDKYTAYTSKS